MKLMKVVTASMIPLLASGVALAQDGRGMGNLGGMGDIWLPVLAVVAIAAVVFWIVKQKGK